MIRISNIKLSVTHSVPELETKLKKILKTNKLGAYSIYKQSIDARKKDDVKFVYTIDVEVENELKYIGVPNITEATPYVFEIPKVTSNKQVVVVGTGPAGLFSALTLIKAGIKPLIIERGKQVEGRLKDVEKFWEDGTLLLESNVQFGEGGAGTFSDGKLTTGIKDKRLRFVLNELIAAGAPKEIGYNAKPHIGTDYLITVVRNIREYIKAQGGTFLFEHKLTNICTADAQRVKQIEVLNLQTNETSQIEVDYLVLAIGHSSRDTFEMLYEVGVEMEAKPFSVGVRIEHPQSLIDNQQYGQAACHLPAADYKLATHHDNNRSAYTFCMCPGGIVVGASSEAEMVVTNGMSYYSRALENANSALLVGIEPSDYGSSHPLAGMYFQRTLEQKAFILGGSNYNAPIQLVGDFLKNQKSTKLGQVIPSYSPGVNFANLHELFPEFIITTLKEAIIAMERKIPGFAMDDAVLTAVESRTSSPIRFTRDPRTLQTNINGIIPCGEGCGFAGGIISSAVDGIKCAQAIISELSEEI
ncbi:MAG: NAD(P)/FAD-dependent oxidoreductase [Mycoplasmatales bacterium]